MPYVDPPVDAPELPTGRRTWLHSPPLRLSDLRGQVVLVDFFDYTCINCLRTLPYLRIWRERYGSRGLRVIGIHAPEFRFARDPARVEENLRRLQVDWPVMLDNDFEAWASFSNEYWPTKYLIDASGRVRYYHQGEGEYEATERAIQEMLREISPEAAPRAPVAPLRASDRPGAVCFPATPELHLGALGGSWGEAFPLPGRPHRYALQRYPKEGEPTLEGLFWVLPEYLAFVGERGEIGRLQVRFSAKEVNVVMDAGEAPEARVGVKIDGAPVPPEDRGEDVQDGRPTWVRVMEARMYQLANFRAFGRHTLELSVPSPTWRAYAFTFVSCTAEEEEEPSRVDRTA